MRRCNVSESVASLKAQLIIRYAVVTDNIKGEIMNIQAGILADLPSYGLYATFDIKAGQLEQAKRILSQLSLASFDVVVGLGAMLCEQNLSFDGMDGKVGVASTPSDVWFWFRGDDPSKLHLDSQRLFSKLADNFENLTITHAFKHQEGRDLSGYEDGTENPHGANAQKAVSNTHKGGGSFVAVQKWQHDLAFFKRQSQVQQDHTIGRRLSDNEELESAPSSAHVKRTAQESYDPEGFMVRRSMPYQEGASVGLMFVAFMHNPTVFKVMMQRMTGAEDGIVDGLFSFSRPLTGAFYWCPPIESGLLRLEGK